MRSQILGLVPVLSCMCVCVYLYACKRKMKESEGVRVGRRETERGTSLETNRESDEKGEGVPLVKHHKFFTEVIGLQWKG